MAGITNEPDDRLIALIVEQAAAETGADLAEIEIVSIEQVTWPDTALGKPEPGNIYAQMMTPGFRIVVTTPDNRIVYHTDQSTRFVRAGEE